MKNTVTHDSLKLTVSRIITLGISLVTAMLLSRFRTLSEYGTYSQILMVVTLAVSIFTMGLPNSINYFLAGANNDNEKTKFLSTYYTFSTLLCIIIGVILVITTPFYVSYFKNESIKLFVYVLAILPWANVIGISIDNILIVYRQTTKLMLFRFLNSLFLLIIVFMVQIFKLTFYHYMLMFIIVQAGFAFWVYIITRNIAGELRLSFNWSLIKSILSFSIPLGLATILGTINVELDKLMIGRFMGIESLAVYTNSGKELPITIVSTSLIAVLMPQMVKLLQQKKCNEAVRLWGDVTVLSYIIICFFATAFLVFAPQVITVLYSEKYLPGVSVFRVYNIVLLLRTTYFGMVLNALGKTKFIMFSSIASLILNLVLNFWFFQLFGFVGPAIATFVSLSIVGFAQLFLSSKCLKISFSKILPWKRLGLITLINVNMGTMFYLITKIFNISISTRDILITILVGFIWFGLYLSITLKMIKRGLKSINDSNI